MHYWLRTKTVATGPGDIYNTGRVAFKFSYRWRSLSLLPFSLKFSGEGIRIDPEEGRQKGRYLINVTLVPYIGFSYNRLPSFLPAKDSISYQGAGNNGDFFSIDQYSTILRRGSLSLLAGLTLQFQHKGKDRLAITIYYNKGFITLVREDIHYSVNGQKFETVLAVRGTVLGVNLSYPIKLYDFEKRRKKNGNVYW